MIIKSSKFKVQSSSLKLKVFYKIINFAFCIVILHFAFCTLHLPKAYAKGISLNIQPANLQIRSTPPADIRVPFNLSNQGENSVELTIILKRFEASSEENGQLIYPNPNLSDERINDSFLQNVQIVDDGFAINSLTLAPKQKKTLDLSIILPKNTAPRDHYFSIIFLSKADQQSFNDKNTDRETISYIQAGISLPVLLAVGNNKNEGIFIDEFSAPIFLQSGPVPFTVKVENIGTHFMSTKGVIIIKNMFGQIVGRVDIPSANILTGTSRYLSNTPQFPLSPQSPQPKVFWSEQFLLGFYTATLTLSSHDNQLLYTRSIHFLAFPFTISFLILIGLVLGFIIFKKVKKRLSED